MKTILLTLCLFTISAYGLMTPEFLKIRHNFDDCLKENNVEGNFFEKLGSKDPNTHCVLSCTLEKLNILNDGVVEKEKIMQAAERFSKIVPKEKLRKALDDCISDDKDAIDKCAYANKVVSCVTNELRNSLLQS